MIRSAKAQLDAIEQVILIDHGLSRTEVGTQRSVERTPASSQYTTDDEDKHIAQVLGLDGEDTDPPEHDVLAAFMALNAERGISPPEGPAAS